MPEPLRIQVDGVDHALDAAQVHHLRVHRGRLAIGTEQTPDTFGSCAWQVHGWWFHPREDQVPADFRLDGVPTVDSMKLDAGQAHEARLAERVGRTPRRRNSGQRNGPERGTRVNRGRRRDDRERVWSIGRAGTGADIPIDDPLVRADHAWLEVDPRGHWWVTENNGRVFVEGRRVMAAVLKEGSPFVVGQTAVAASPALLGGGWRPGNPPPPAHRQGSLGVSAGSGLAIEVRDVVVRRDDKVILDGVSLSATAGQVLAVVGPSGAGKSTLMKVLLGDITPDSGTVAIGNATGRYGETRPVDRMQIHYVPQADDLYQALTVAETLRYAARFRSAPDATDDYIERRVRDAMDALGLAPHAGKRVGKLSGGQRRRVSIGIELVGDPQLLILDEPTSGLDLAKDREVMQQLQTVSRRYHCTVVVVTHAVTHLEYADQLVVLARGGVVEYAGPPVHPTLQGHATWADWLHDLDRERERPSRRPAPGGGARPAPPLRREGSLTGLPWALGRQAMVIARRGLRSLTMLTAMPLVGTLLAIMAADTGLRPDGSMAQVLAILVTVAALTGAALSYLDLVSDRAITERDWRVGLSSWSLVAAKTIVFGGICAVLSGAMTALYAATRDLPPQALGVPPVLMLFMTLLLIMFGSMSLGMLISALSDTVERAVTYNTLLAVFQVALSGALFEIPGWGTPLAVLLPGRVGLAAVACYADLNAYRPAPAYQDALWSQHPIRFWMLCGAMGLIAVFALLLTRSRMERRYAHG
ncbi:ATP-binding cassette domain-containing protein [Catellatospora sp. NPDC049609]|uniref:ATP-binding cassette domain-containing protein n=1 Tax=Catellatospora sp. NPDC049609 TaxID=3155505 RepID=UPI0034385157